MASPSTIEGMAGTPAAFAEMGFVGTELFTGFQAEPTRTSGAQCQTTTEVDRRQLG